MPAGRRALPGPKKFCFLLCQAERNPPRWACRPALRFTSGQCSRKGFDLRAELLNTPWRRIRFLAVCLSPCAGIAAALRKVLRLRSRREHQWLELNAEASAARAVKN